MRHRGRLVWLLVATAAALAVVTSFGYLGGFLDPDGDARDLPMAVVNLDRRAEVAGSRVAFGEQVIAELRAADAGLGDAVAWQTAPTRDDALAKLRQDRVYAVLVVPAEFSTRLAALVSGGATRPATIEVLTNPAAGSYAGAFSQAVATGAVDQVSRQAAEQLTATLDGLGVRLTPAAAAAVGRPVEARVTVAHAVGDRGGRGLAPFYFAVVVVVAALFATSTVNVAVDVAAGRQPLEVLGRRVRLGPAPARGGPLGLWRAKLTVIGPVAATVGLTVTAVAVGPLDMTVGRPWLLGGVAVVGAAATAAVTLALYAAFDLAGSLLAALFLVIYGVPASGGVYPVQAMPDFFRFLHGWLPLRYLVDAVRSPVFGDGPPGALGRGVAVLAGYTAAGGLAARRATRRQAPRPASASASTERKADTPPPAS